MKSRPRDNHNRVDRRDFVLGSASLAVAASAGLVGCSDDDQQTPDRGNDAPLPGETGPGKEAGADLGPDAPPGETGPGKEAGGDGPLPGSSRVVEVHDPKALSGKVYDAARVKAMLHAGLKTLTATSDLKQAWKKLLPSYTSATRIGIKVNCLSFDLYNSTELLSALVATLVADLGADAKKIVVWDRRGDELSRSKITEASVGCPVLGTIKSIKDSSGPGYESAALAARDKKTHLSKILTQQTDVTINIPVLKTHGISGVTGALKNIYGVIDNPGDFHTNLNDYLPALYGLSPIPKHVVLNITEALLAVTKGDTTSPPDKIAARIFLSTDPVAHDAHTVALINTLRGTLPPVPVAKLKWLENAETLGLGTRKVDLKLVKPS